MRMTEQQDDSDGGIGGDPRPRISFGSWSEYSFDMSQFQGADGSDNDFRESVCGQNWGFEGYSTNNYAEYGKCCEHGGRDGEPTEGASGFGSRGCSRVHDGHLQKMLLRCSPRAEQCSAGVENAGMSHAPTINGARDTCVFAHNHHPPHLLRYQLKEERYVFLDDHSDDGNSKRLPGPLQAWLQPPLPATNCPVNHSFHRCEVDAASSIPNIASSSTIDKQPSSAFRLAEDGYCRDNPNCGSHPHHRQKGKRGNVNTECVHRGNFNHDQRHGSPHLCYGQAKVHHSPTQRRKYKPTAKKKGQNKGCGGGGCCAFRCSSSLEKGDRLSSTCESRASLTSVPSTVNSGGDNSNRLGESSSESIPTYQPPHKRGLIGAFQVPTKAKTKRSPFMTMSYYPLTVNHFGSVDADGRPQNGCGHFGGIKVWRPYVNLCKSQDKSCDAGDAWDGYRSVLPFRSSSTTSTNTHSVEEFRVLKALTDEKAEQSTTETGDEREEARKMPLKPEEKQGTEAEKGPRSQAEDNLQVPDTERREWHWQQRIYGAGCHAVDHACGSFTAGIAGFRSTIERDLYCGYNSGEYAFKDDKSEIGADPEKIAGLNKNDRGIIDETRQNELEADNETILVYKDGRTSFDLQEGRERWSGESKLETGRKEKGAGDRKDSGGKGGRAYAEQKRKGGRRSEGSPRKQKGDSGPKNGKRESGEGMKGGRGGRVDSAGKEEAAKMTEKEEKSIDGSKGRFGTAAADATLGRAELQTEEDDDIGRYAVRKSKSEINLFEEIQSKTG